MIAFLVAEGAKINVRNRDGVTPLIAVSATSRLDTVSFLVDNQAEINAHGNRKSKADWHFPRRMGAGFCPGLVVRVEKGLSVKW